MEADTMAETPKLTQMASKGTASPTRNVREGYR